MPNIGIVAGSFHKKEIERMMAEAKSEAETLGLTVTDEVWVPGSVEKPLAIKRLLMRDDIDAVVVIGVIERGKTKHGFTMGQSLMHFTMQLSIDFMKPVGLGVLGPEILPEQIEPRMLPYAKAAVHAANAML
jgi:6,7-dimethyl-8-ribityllumazine synthase